MLVFVYGTLKKNKERGGLLTDFVGDGFTSNLTLHLPNDEFPFPFCIKEKDGRGCYGEVYNINDEELIFLDAIEGNGFLYERKEVEVTLSDLSKHKCIVYTLCDGIVEERNNFKQSLKF